MKRPPEDMRQLMRHIKEYKRLEDDRQQSKGKAPVTTQYSKEFRQGSFQPRLRRDVRIQEPGARAGEVNVTFKELMHKILDQIKNKSYFRWPSKIEGDPLRRNQNLYCIYHWDKRHTTEQCRVLKDHLEQLVRSGHLKEFVLEPRGQEIRQNTRPQGNPLPPSLGVIEVIHAASRGTLVTQRKGVLIVVPAENCREE